MIDTIRALWPHTVAAGVIMAPPNGWESTSFTRAGFSSRNCFGSSQGFRLTHHATGLSASGSGHQIRSVQFSLPNVLFGSNGQLIKSQAEIDQAMARAAELLTQVGQPVGVISHYSRVDLCWQFALDPELAILAHRHARHPRIRSNAGRYEGQSLFWAGSGLRVRMYDKELEMIRRRGNILRVEFQLQNRLLEDLMPAGEPRLNRLDFNRAYRVFRELMLGFEPNHVPEISDISELLAIAEAAGCRYGGLSLFDIWARGKNPQHVHRVQREIATLRPRLFGVEWSTLLPADGPPEVVEL